MEQSGSPFSAPQPRPLPLINHIPPGPTPSTCQPPAPSQQSRPGCWTQRCCRQHRHQA
ncbi:hypothetical protein VULLAG_LOCUS19225 [Vulpes lagopus]